MRILQFVFGKPFGKLHRTGIGKRIYVNPTPEEADPPLSKLCREQHPVLGQLSSNVTAMVLGIASGLPIRISNLSNYLRKIKTNGELKKIVKQWELAKGNFTNNLYEGLRDGREEFYERTKDPAIRNQVISLFKHENSYTPGEIKLFIDSVTNFISTSLIQMNDCYPWSLALVLLRHRANGVRHAERGVQPKYVPTIRHAIITALGQEVVKHGGPEAWKNETDYKMWGEIFDNVWDSFTQGDSRLLKKR